MQEQARIAELIRHIQNGYVERFTFFIENLQKSVGVARGVEPQCGQQVTLEGLEDKLLFKIPGKMGKEGKVGTEKICGKERQHRLTVVLRIEDGEPIVKEALWDEECRQYVAIADGAEVGDKLEIYILGNADENEI